MKLFNKSAEIIFGSLVVVLILISCGQASQRELDLKEKELVLKERELSLKEKNANNSTDTSIIVNAIPKTLTKEEKWQQFWKDFKEAFANKDKERIKALTAEDFFPGGGGETIEEWLNDIAFKTAAFNEIQTALNGKVKSVKNNDGSYYKATGKGDVGDLYFDYKNGRWQFGGVIGD